jgi:hypothetical protein
MQVTIITCGLSFSFGIEIRKYLLTTLNDCYAIALPTAKSSGLFCPPVSKRHLFSLIFSP